MFDTLPTPTESGQTIKEGSLIHKRIYITQKMFPFFSPVTNQALKFQTACERSRLARTPVSLLSFFATEEGGKK